jgi:hypothetical protein
VGGWRPSLVLLALTAAFAAVLESPAPNQNAHLAQVTAFSHGTARIDPYHHWTRDIAYVNGHYFAAKAPGLALFTLPWYEGLRATGLVVAGPPPSVPWPRAETQAMPRTAPWEVALFGAALPCFVLLLLVRRAAERLVPGYGLLAAVSLGAGSLVGVFSTLFFDHELSALLGFGAFVLLLHERSRHPSLQLVAAGGIVAGLAIDTEFPVALLALVLAGYAAARPGALHRVATYAGGVLVGVLPELAFNLWTGHSLSSTAYAHAVLEPGKSGHDVLGANTAGFYGVSVPSPHAFVALLVSAKGLFVLTPLWALAAVGLVALWRRGSRAEAATAGSVVAIFLLYDAGYYLPFGGFNAGPRFLVPVLPFLALGVASAWRAWPGPALALACASVIVTTLSVLADPMLVSEDVGTMFHRLVRGGDVNGPLPLTVFHWAWGARIAPLLVVGAVVVLGVAGVFAVVARRLTRRDALLGLAALLAWRVVYVGAPLVIHARGGWFIAGVLALVAAGGIVLLVRGEPSLAAPAVLVLPLLWPPYAAHTTIAFTTVSGAMLALALWAIARQRAGSRAAR